MQEARIFLELMTLDRKLKASREVQGSGFGVWGLGSTARTAVLITPVIRLVTFRADNISARALGKF